MGQWAKASSHAASTHGASRSGRMQVDEDIADASGTQFACFTSTKVRTTTDTEDISNVSVTGSDAGGVGGRKNLGGGEKRKNERDTPPQSVGERRGGRPSQLSVRMEEDVLEESGVLRSSFHQVC